MAKIILLGIPAHGHTNPTLPVVKELVTRGHQVLCYNGEEMRAKIERAGGEFRVYPDTVPNTEQVARSLHTIIDATLMLIDMTQLLTPYMMEELRREQPDLIIYDSTCAWGYLTARTLGIPSICLITTFVLEGSDGAIPFGAIARHLFHAILHLPKIIRWKRWMNQTYGKEIAGGITEFGDLNIVFTSREFQPPNHRIDEIFRFVGPSINPATRQENFPFERLNDQSIIYISLGTVHSVQTNFYTKVFEAFRDYPAQFVLSMGQFTDIETLGTIPTNFIVRNSVPQLAILERASAFITHGGMNSIHEGLYYGVPQVVVPQQMEQLMNGIQVKRQGAGVLIGDKYPYGNVTIDQLQQALTQVMNTASYRQNAERIGKTLREAGGFHHAVDEIEALWRS